MNNTICYPFPSGKVIDKHFIEEQDLTTATTRYSSVGKRKSRDPLANKKTIDNIKDLPDEKWRPIDKKGRYYVSSLGRVKSLCGTVARLLKPYLN